MKNGSISKQLELQNQDFTDEKKKKIFQSSEKENNISCNLDSKKNNEQSNNQQNNSRSDSLLSVFSGSCTQINFRFPPSSLLSFITA